jgi:hypothetical protein
MAVAGDLRSQTGSGSAVKHCYTIFLPLTKASFDQSGLLGQQMLDEDQVQYSGDGLDT